MAQVKFLSGPKANLDTLKNSDGGKLTVGALYFCEDVQRLYRAIKEDEYVAVDEQFVIALEEPTVNNTVEGKIYLYNSNLYAKVDEEVKMLSSSNMLEEAKAYTDEKSIFNNGITTVNALGGIAAGTSLDNKSVLEILDMLLFPYVKQTVSSVSGTPNGGTFEKGNTQTITQVKGTVTKKSKPITKVEILQGSTVLATKEGDEVKNGGTFTFTGLSVSVPSTNVQLTFRATDENGSVVTGTTGAFTFVYPYYYGICDAGAIVNEALVEGLTKDIKSKGEKAYTYSPNNQCAVIAYPKAHGVLKSALDPNAFENISAFTRHEINITGLDGTTQAYYVYVSGAFTGSGFKYTFKY